MKLEDQVTSLALSRRLKELGVKQDVQPGDCYWVEVRSRWKLFLQSEDEDNVSTVPYPWCKAYSVAELGEMLKGKSPGGMGTTAYSDMEKKWWVSGGEWKGPGNPGSYSHLVVDEKETDARAKMLIYLIKKGLVKPKALRP